MTIAMSTEPSRPVRSLGEVSDRMIEALSRGRTDPAIIAALRRGERDLSHVGPPPAPEPDRHAGDVSAQQAAALKLIWANSIREAAHDDYLRWRLDDLDANQKPNTLRNWLGSLVEAKRLKARPEILHLIVPGNIGSGKTTALAALGNEASEQGLTVRFVKHATYLTWRRPDGGPSDMRAYDVRKKHVGCDLLILDELCGEMDGIATEFARRETVDLVDSRAAAGRPTAFSTNLRSRSTPDSPAPGIADILGERLLSRMRYRAHKLEIRGPDRRQPSTPLDW